METPLKKNSLPKYSHAVTRKPPTSMADGITTQDIKIDLDLAQKQHALYVDTLRQLGVNVTILEAEENFPDSHFVEDAAIIHKNKAILTRPGAKTRRGEVACLRPTLERMLPLYSLGGDEYATVDGGDILFIDNHVFIGISHRTNLDGAQELKTLLHNIDHNLQIHFVPFKGVLHLKSGLTALNKNLLLGNPKIILEEPLPFGEIIWLPKDEGYAANTLAINGAALIFEECKSAYAAVQKAGLIPIALNMSEFRKMDGSFTCLSLLW